MREIKFRQWLGNRYEYWGVGVNCCSFVSPCSGILINAETTTHEQFTGLHDRNGTEIYEGDIIGFGDDRPGDLSGMYGSLGYVEYSIHEGAFVVTLNGGRIVQLADHLLFSSGKTCRCVYGNIHQNPELINA